MTDKTQRRAFLKLGLGAGAAAIAAPAIAARRPEIPESRMAKALELRMSAAASDEALGAASNVDNGDFELYPDKAGTYTKGLPHDNFGRVDLNAFQTFMTAIKSGKFSDFEQIIIGGTRKQNGPQGGLAYDLSAMDSVQFGAPVVPPAPPIASDQTAQELLEHYWGSLLRDVNFSDYGSNSLAAAAAAEMGRQATYTGPRDSRGNVTPDLLFRGPFVGETVGPYVSQFMVQPTFLGSMPINQIQETFVPGIDYGTDFASWLQIQNGVDTGLRNQIDLKWRYPRNGRDLSSYTHMDVLYQAYLIALLVLAGIHPNPPGSFTSGGAPLNPGNPYAKSKTENGFGTWGGPDFGATLGEVACKALNASWYQKWFVHLRPRPEAIGGLVHLIMTGQQDKTDVRMSNVILNSQGLQESYNKFGSYLLAQSYPEGSPTHPSYPTGHGVVAGACITTLKFFYDGNFVIPNPLVPSSDGLSLQPYTGPDADKLTVNGELNKLAHNVSFGHGIHAGIHWRSDSDTSLLLGEAVALSFLSDKARTYNEPFTVNITKLDGTIATITSAGNA